MANNLLWECYSFVKMWNLIWIHHLEVTGCHWVPYMPFPLSSPVVYMFFPKISSACFNYSCTVNVVRPSNHVNQRNFAYSGGWLKKSNVNLHTLWSLCVFQSSVNVPSGCPLSFFVAGKVTVLARGYVTPDCT